MKEVLLLAFFLVSISCENKPTEFHGLGGLNIGADFASLPISKNFTNVMKDEFNIRQFQLSDKIGSVSDLNVTTENGKISEVSFYSNEETNISEVQQIYGNLVEIKTDSSIMNNFGLVMKFYHTPDEQILFSVTQHNDKPLKNSIPLYKYSYKDAKMESTKKTF